MLNKIAIVIYKVMYNCDIKKQDYESHKYDNFFFFLQFKSDKYEIEILRQSKPSVKSQL